MKNIWFIRTDKDGMDNIDVTEQSPYIYSMHGICGDSDYVKEYKSKIFPKLVLSESELRSLVISIKNQLIEDGKIDTEEKSKVRCDLAIANWLARMEEEDIVFVRNKQQKVIVGRVTGYVSKAFFDEHGFFQRPIEILAFLKNEHPYQKLWQRTNGRKTIERNANRKIRTSVLDFLKTLKL